MYHLLIQTPFVFLKKFTSFTCSNQLVHVKKILFILCKHTTPYFGMAGDGDGKAGLGRRPFKEQV